MLMIILGLACLGDTMHTIRLVCAGHRDLETLNGRRGPLTKRKFYAIMHRWALPCVCSHELNKAMRQFIDNPNMRTLAVLNDIYKAKMEADFKMDLYS